jgi:hypothetical protein
VNYQIHKHCVACLSAHQRRRFSSNKDSVFDSVEITSSATSTHESQDAIPPDTALLIVPSIRRASPATWRTFSVPERPATFKAKRLRQAQCRARPSRGVQRLWWHHTHAPLDRCFCIHSIDWLRALSVSVCGLRLAMTLWEWMWDSVWVSTFAYLTPRIRPYITCRFMPPGLSLSSNLAFASMSQHQNLNDIICCASVSAKALSRLRS